MGIKKATRNGYAKGLNRDTDKHQPQNENLYWNENFRLITQTGESNTLLENVKGNKLLKTITGQFVGAVYPNYIIIGNYIFDNKDIILFTVSNNKGIDDYYTTSRIILYKYDIDNNGYLNPIILFIDHDNDKIGHLRLKNNISCIGRTENNFIRKIYWTDNDNELRYANISPDIDEVTGEPKQGNIEADYTQIRTQSITKFNLLQNINVSDKIIITDMVSGELKSGMVSYSYRFFNKHGSISNIGQTTQLYPIISADISKTSYLLEGDPLNTNTKKGFKGYINISTVNMKYDYIQIIGIYYESIDSEPTIKIITQQPLDYNKVDFVDNGRDYISSLTYDEFKLINNSYIIKTLEHKDDRLFIGNIKEKYFDVDFDSRCYRFADDGTGYKRSTIYQSDLNTFMNVTGSNWNSVPNNHDCINKYKNHLEYDRFISENPSFDFKYQRDGHTIGGEGPNLYYYFITESNVINGDPTSTKFDVIINHKLGNDSIDYLIGVKKGLQRDEIYRFGIVFFNNKGQQSFVKWIGDIRTPNIKEYAMFDDSSAKNLQILFGFRDHSTIPKNEDGTVMNAQIVYVKRTLKDRTVIASGYDFSMRYTDKIYSGITEESYTFKYDIQQQNDYNNNSTPYKGKVREFISADLEYNTLKTNDTYIDRQFVISDTAFLTDKINRAKNSATNPSPDYMAALLMYRKLIWDNAILPISFDIKHKDIIDVKNIESYPDYKYTTGGSSLANAEFFGMKRYIVSDISIVPNLYKPPINSTSTDENIRYSNILNGYCIVFDGDSYNNDINQNFYSYIKRNIIPYGGDTYENRKNNTYIPITDIIDTSHYSTMTTSRGDTTINYYAKVRSTISRMFNLLDTDGGTAVFGSILDTENLQHNANKPIMCQSQGTTQSVYLPMETSLILPLIHGFKIYKHINDLNVRLIQKTNNNKILKERIYTDQFSTTLNVIKLERSSYLATVVLNYKDIYLYNSVYSVVNSSKTFYSKPLVWEKLYKFYNNIRWSDIKHNGELFDSWLIFRPNNIQELNSDYGQLEQLINWKNYLFAFQHKGMCLLPINERATTVGTNGSSIILGEGDVFSKNLNYSQGSDKYGLQNNNSVITSEHGIYWIDTLERKLLVYNGKTMETNFIKGMSSWLRDNINENTIYSAGYDNQFKEVLFSWNNRTLVFSELLNSFQGIYTFSTPIFMNNSSLLSTHITPYNTDCIYEHNVGDRTRWYDTNYHSLFEIIVNDQTMVTKEFNNIEYLSESFNEINNTDNYQDTLNTIQSFNDFLMSEEIKLLPYTKGDILYTGGLNIPLTAPNNIKNIRRRERMWRTMIPRIDSNNQLIDNYRMRDAYVKLRFTYNNDNNYKFILHPITTYYTLSNLE